LKSSRRKHMRKHRQG